MPRRRLYKRDAPLAICPKLACRRSRRCLHDTRDDPCHRLYWTQDQFYEAIADKLDALTAEARRRDPEGKNFAPEGSLEFERRYKFLYDSLRAADQASCAAEAAAARQAQKQKPARARGA